MIKEFKGNTIRDTGVINKGMFEQVKLLYQRDPAVAGELAISLMELVLTGEYSSDDFMVEFAIANHKIIVEKNQEKYEKNKEANRAAKIEKYKLDVIAKMVNEGHTQTAIGKAIGESKATVSYRVKNMLPEYPELMGLDENSVSQKSQKNQKSQKDVNVNVNVNDNVNIVSCFPSKIGEVSPNPSKTISKREGFKF